MKPFLISHKELAQNVGSVVAVDSFDSNCPSNDNNSLMIHGEGIEKSYDIHNHIVDIDGVFTISERTNNTGESSVQSVITNVRIKFDEIYSASFEDYLLMLSGIESEGIQLKFVFPHPLYYKIVNGYSFEDSEFIRTSLYRQLSEREKYKLDTLIQNKKNLQQYKKLDISKRIADILKTKNSSNTD